MWLPPLLHHTPRTRLRARLAPHAVLVLEALHDAAEVIIWADVDVLVRHEGQRDAFVAGKDEGLGERGAGEQAFGEDAARGAAGTVLGEAEGEEHVANVVGGRGVGKGVGGLEVGGVDRDVDCGRWGSEYAGRDG